MNKQRLLELAGVLTEAKQAGKQEFFVVVEIIDGEPSAYGPFRSAKQAGGYLEYQRNHLESDYDDVDAHVVQVFKPEE